MASRAIDVHLGSQVRMARISQGVTADAFAQKLCIDPSELEEIECGRVRIDPSILIDASSHLKVDLDGLFVGAPDIVVTPDMAEVSHEVSMFLAEVSALELIPIFNGLRSDEDRQAVLDFAKFLAEPLRSDGPSAHVVPPRNRPTPFRSR
jgi:transcriptional regulator with XRE-family HTH domain